MSIQEQFQSALAAQKEGRYSDAEQQYLVLLNEGYKAEAVLNALVDISIASNDSNKAAIYLERLCLLVPNEMHYCQSLANLCAQAGLWGVASDCYKRFVSNNSGHADAHYNYAYNLKQDRRFDDALTQYQIALDCSVRVPEEVLTNMAVICSQYLRQDQRALDLLEQALLLNCDYVPALYNIASLYEEDGDKVRAVEKFNRVILLQPENYQAVARLAELTVFFDTNDPIITKMRRALDSKVLETEVRINLSYALAKAYNDCADYDRAFECYQKSNGLDAQNNEPYSRIAHENMVKTNIRFFSHEWFEKLTPISDESPVFICGMFRSGSTLAEQILASHPEVIAGGERDFFFEAINSSLKPYPESLDNVSGERLASIANDYIVDLKKKFLGSSIVTDKRPDNFLYIGLIKTLFPNAKIILTTRAPLDNCLSIYFLRLAPVMNYATDLSDIAHYYLQHQRLMNYWKSLFGDSIYSLSYDKLVESPESNIRDLLKFLDLQWSEDCLNFHKLKNRVKTASVWQVRQPLYRSSSGRWKNYVDHLSTLIEALEAGEG